MTFAYIFANWAKTKSAVRADKYFDDILLPQLVLRQTFYVTLPKAARASMIQEHDPAQSGGPYLLIACLCENVVQRADGVLTLVNIVDRVNITSQGFGASESMPPTNFSIYLTVVLKAGRARGRYDLKVVPELPDGTTKAPAIMSLNFEGEDDRGIQVIHQIVITLTHEGLYWFSVYFADRLLTRLPLRVVYSRIIGGLPRPV